MLNKKRLKNLSLLKQKRLLNQKIEISTLDNEFEKNKTNKKKLKDILDNTSIDSTESAWNMKEKSQYKLKLIERPSTLGGVPVFILPVLNPTFLRDSEIP